MKIKLIVYRGYNEVLVTTPSQEEKFLEEWFTNGGRDTRDYTREPVYDTGFKVRAKIE